MMVRFLEDPESFIISRKCMDSILMKLRLIKKVERESVADMRN
jgi:hypothetical protein